MGKPHRAEAAQAADEPLRAAVAHRHPAPRVVGVAHAHLHPARAGAGGAQPADRHGPTRGGCLPRGKRCRAAQPGWQQQQPGWQQPGWQQPGWTPRRRCHEPARCRCSRRPGARRGTWRRRWRARGAARRAAAAAAAVSWVCRRAGAWRGRAGEAGEAARGLLGGKHGARVGWRAAWAARRHGALPPRQPGRATGGRRGCGRRVRRCARLTRCHGGARGHAVAPSREGAHARSLVALCNVSYRPRGGAAVAAAGRARRAHHREAATPQAAVSAAASYCGAGGGCADGGGRGSGGWGEGRRGGS